MNRLYILLTVMVVMVGVGAPPFFAAHEALAELLTGTSGNDTLLGTDSDDRLKGRGGEAYLKGSGGNDYLKGGGGDATIEGGGGNDEIIHGELLRLRDGRRDIVDEMVRRLRVPTVRLGPVRHHDHVLPRR